MSRTIASRRQIFGMPPALVAAQVAASGGNGAEATIASLDSHYAKLNDNLCAAEDARDCIAFGSEPHSPTAEARKAVLCGKVDRLFAALNEVEKAVAEVQAVSAEAMRAKARFWLRWADREDLAADPVLAGLMQDLARGEG